VRIRIALVDGFDQLGLGVLPAHVQQQRLRPAFTGRTYHEFRPGDSGAPLRQPVHELPISGLYALRIAGGDVTKARDGVGPAFLDVVEIAGEPVGGDVPRIDG